MKTGFRSLIPRLLLFTFILIPIRGFAQRLPAPDTAEIFLHGSSIDRAATIIAGRGLPIRGVEFAMVRSAANQEIVWREVRRTTDSRGGTHVFYSQYAVGKGLDAELFGSGIGVHYTPQGQVLAIIGRQFETASVADGLIMPVDQALRAADRAVAHAESRFDSGRTLFDEHRAARIANTKLKLVQVNGVFRPAYSTSVDDADGETHSVIIDARTEEVLDRRSANRGGNCTPDNTTAVKVTSALGFPARWTSVPPPNDRPPEPTRYRALKASVANTVRQGFTHEGFYPTTLPNGGRMHIYVYQEVDSTSHTWRCSTTKWWTLYPLKADLSRDSIGRPLYIDTQGNNGVGTFRGEAAADALYHTQRTMYIFAALGRLGWDDGPCINGDPQTPPCVAMVTVSDKAYTDNKDQAKFNYTAPKNAPLNSVRVGPANKMYSAAASLDWIAHEWGHGVMFETQLVENSPNGEEIEEGLADVIGMMVEKRVQLSGTGFEQDSDWVMHEDSAVSGYARGAIDDGSGHSWVGPGGPWTLPLDDRVHRLDEASVAGAHATGNLLNVVHMLMSIGGSNPICARSNSASRYPQGCSAGDAITTPIGSDKAGSLLFWGIEHNINGTATWTQLADMFTLAAYQRFNNCAVDPNANASLEQNVVMKAFRAIGYPRASSALIQCQ